MKFVLLALPAAVLAGGGAWDRIGPWNIFDAVNAEGGPGGEAGTLACAASPPAHPEIIYAGGQNNGVSSGVIKTVDGGRTWTRNSNGLWDTAVLATWVHPDDASGDHVLCGTHSGVYESLDGAASWKFRAETQGWGNVMSFRKGSINGEGYVLANSQNGILTQPFKGGNWSKIASPGGIAANAHLSVVETKGVTEVLTCIGGWGGGQLYYAKLNSGTDATWTGPIITVPKTYKTWDFFPGQSAIYGSCKTPTTCNSGITPLGKYATLEACQAAVNATAAQTAVAWYTYQHNVSGLGDYAAMCYVGSTFSFAPTRAGNVDSGRAPGTFPGQAIDCANAAVDPKDRDHFIYAKAGQFRAWESYDAGKTVNLIVAATKNAYFVMIDLQGWYFTATQAGAFMSKDRGQTWNALHVVMHTRAGKTIDRVPHDYQRIVPDFRGDQVAFPSDQGLHILNRSAAETDFKLISAVGDMHNTMSLSAILAPNAEGSRNLIVNLWDWDVGASFNDGATWRGWNATEKSPGSCGEGGGGQGLGASGNMIMFHHKNWWQSGDGGHNWIRGDLPGGGSSFDYVRKAGSRSEPAGTVFAILNAPLSTPSPPIKGADGDGDDCHAVKGSGVEDEWCREVCKQPGSDKCPDNLCVCDDNDDGGASAGGTHYVPDAADGRDPKDGDFEIEEMNPSRLPYNFTAGMADPVNGNVNWLMTSEDFGQNWTWVPLPSDFQAGWLACDPTDPSALLGLTPSCLKRSTDKGLTWGGCYNGTGLSGHFTKVLIKDSKTMFMMRSGAVPLRTSDGGASWKELTAAAPLFKYGATLDGVLSWTGKTLVLSGFDRSAVKRGVRGTHLWKSTDDGNTFSDEIGDVVTNSPGPVVWYDKDLYWVTRGEGVMVKRNFE